jgi:hypothetical protein
MHPTPPTHRARQPAATNVADPASAAPCGPTFFDFAPTHPYSLKVQGTPAGVTFKHTSRRTARNFSVTFSEHKFSQGLYAPMTRSLGKWGGFVTCVTRRIAGGILRRLA